MDKLLESKDVQIDKIRILYRAFNIMSIAILALLIFPLLYYSSLPEKISVGLELAKAFSNVVTDYITKAITVFLSGLSGYVGNIILSVLGNLIYDFGKKFIRNRNAKGRKVQRKE